MSLQNTFWSFNTLFPPYSPYKGTLPISLLLNENLYSSVSMVFINALLLSLKWPQYKVVKASYQRNLQLLKILEPEILSSAALPLLCGYQ